MIICLPSSNLRIDEGDFVSLNVSWSNEYNGHNLYNPVQTTKGTLWCLYNYLLKKKIEIKYMNYLAATAIIWVPLGAINPPFAITIKIKNFNYIFNIYNQHVFQVLLYLLVPSLQKQLNLVSKLYQFLVLKEI